LTSETSVGVSWVIVVEWPRGRPPFIVVSIKISFYEDALDSISLSPTGCELIIGIIPFTNAILSSCIDASWRFNDRGSQGYYLPMFPCLSLALTAYRTVGRLRPQAQTTG
jgi:hypothetical protein